MADKVFAHPEQRAQGAHDHANYHEVIEALGVISQVTQFVSGVLLDDSAFGSIIPIAQYEVLENLDKPWAQTASLDELNFFWRELATSMDLWLETEGIFND